MNGSIARILSLGCLVSVACSAALAQGGDTIQLRYKVADGLTYTSKRTEKVNRRHWDGSKKSFHFTVKKVLAERVEDSTDGSLLRTIEQQSGSLSYLDAPAKQAVKQPKFQERIDVFGTELALVPGAEGAEPGRMRLVFPKRPLTIGATWEYTAPASHQFPAPLTTRYRLAGIKDFRGRRCAYIKARTKYRGRHEDRNVEAELKSRGQIYFSLDDGCIVNAISTTRFTLDFLKKRDDGRPAYEQKTIDIRMSLK